MRPEEIRKLLGGYATGTLTPEEQQALFAAAMEDQDLFDALAREQALRDLLRDPAARGELLSALDRPALGFAAFWQWLRQPLVASAVTACFLGVIGVAVWHGSHAVPDRMIVAEVRQQDLQDQSPRSVLPAPQAAPQAASEPSLEISRSAAQQGASENKLRAFSPPAQIPAGMGGGGGGARRPEPAKAADNAAPAVAMAKKEMAPVAPPPPPTAAPAPAPTPATVAAQPNANAIAVTAGSVTVQGQLQDVQQTLDARSIFYLQPSAVSGFVDSAGPAPQRASSATLATTGAVPVQRPGVRVSILRGDQEVDPTTVLNAGESVRLKLMANAEGFLSVTEGTRVIASGAAHRMQAFETPPLTYTNAGARQLVITFSRTPVSGGLAASDAAARPNLVERSADQGRATYVVSNAPLDGNQVVLPVTLTYR
jgi:hypothetical protein